MTESTQDRIKIALRELEDSGQLPMNAGELVEELMKVTKLARSTVYRYQKQWRRYSRPPRTSLDENLLSADSRQRFLISIRMPADLLLWLKSEGEVRNIGYQSLLVSMLYWSKENPLVTDQVWESDDEEE
ncbi:MAG: hypothetical protein H7Y22_05305 [Gemmatimonadaceae bacterium]|nr:hypothetical protein [Gloeobacterales cyanobacterium ES-bin-141]